ncbi:MAG: gamma-glutamyl-phosphate reductase, partial [Verrucomicrobiota bacterium]
MSLEQEIREIAVRSKVAGLDLMKRPLAQLNSALEFMALELEARKEQIFAANALDLEAAGKRGLTGAMLERLKIKESS